MKQKKTTTRTHERYGTKTWKGQLEKRKAYRETLDRRKDKTRGA